MHAAVSFGPLRTIRAVALVTAILFVAETSHTRAESYPPPEEVREAFLKLLDRPRVPLDPQTRKTETDPAGHTDDYLSIASERKADETIERVPRLIVRPGKPAGKLPAVIVLHGTGGNKESQRGVMLELVRRGMMGVALDARYHGERSGGAGGSEAYVAAITGAWRTPAGKPQEHPFYYDTCWDIWRTVDYLQTRSDIDGDRLGIIGFSMGGIQTWLAAAVDTRLKVAVPAIAVQSFRWSLENEQWQGRARTIEAAHRAAAMDLGETSVNARVCQELWNKVIPGMLDQFDCPSMLRLFADRPLLILNGELDPNCPLGGAKVAFESAEQAYRTAGANDRLKIKVASGTAHAVTDEQHKEAMAWFSRWLVLEPPGSK